MESPRPVTDILRDTQIKEYFLMLQESALSDEEKYQRFATFCGSPTLTREQFHLLQNAVSSPTAAAPEYDPEKSLARVIECLERAVLRVQRSQHKDGGWGLQVEKSNFWHTAYAVLFLKTVESLPLNLSRVDADCALNRGAAYLEQHPEFWAADTLTKSGGMPVYEISIMARCFYHLRRSIFRHESAVRIYRSINRLYQSQNDDGGWDVNIWGYAARTPTRVWSEAGATSMVLQAMAVTGDERFRQAMEKGIHWLGAAQNPEGCWNDGSCHPLLPAFTLPGNPSVRKTCDALQGILTGEALNIPLMPYRAGVDRAVNWLRLQTKPILDLQNRLSGRGSGYTAIDYENTCMALETFVRLPNAPLDLLAEYTSWLIESQRRQADDPEDGSWVLGHTARIALALADYYRCASEGGKPARVPWVS